MLQTGYRSHYFDVCRGDTETAEVSISTFPFFSTGRESSFYVPLSDDHQLSSSALYAIQYTPVTIPTKLASRLGSPTCISGRLTLIRGHFSITDSYRLVATIGGTKKVASHSAPGETSSRNGFRACIGNGGVAANRMPP